MRYRRESNQLFVSKLSVTFLAAFLMGSAALAVPPLKSTAAPAPGLTDLAILENRFFSHPYAHDPVEKRLERLECMVFGGLQAGGNEERLAKLMKVVAERSQMPLQGEKTPAKSSVNQGGAAPKSPAAAVPVPAGSGQYPVLNTLEWRALKKTFAGEGLDQRLERLEAKMFGQAAQGMAYADRVERLRKTLGIGIDTGVAGQPSTAGGIGPAPRARARDDYSDGGLMPPSFGFGGGPSVGMPGAGQDFGFGFGFPGGMDATFDKQFHTMIDQMNRHMEEARRLGPGTWRFDPKTNTWIDVDSGRQSKLPAADAPRTAPGRRVLPAPPMVAPPRVGQPDYSEVVPPYADPNSI